MRYRNPGEVGKKEMQRKQDSNEGRVAHSIAKSRTRNIALIGMLAGSYAVLTMIQGPLSFINPNFRLANILISVVPILGWPAVIGISAGVFLGNITSPLGPIDLISALFSFVGLSAIHLLRKKTVLLGLGIYSLLLSAWVSFELELVVHAPYFPTFYFVLAGIATITMGFGYVCYRYLTASGLGKKIDNAL
jgi:uncharacterized membrane protein